MNTSKFDKLIYVVGIYSVASFVLKTTTKTVKNITKELEKARIKAEAKTPIDALDELVADMSDEEKTALESHIKKEFVEYLKATMTGEPTMKTEG